MEEPRIRKALSHQGACRRLYAGGVCRRYTKVEKKVKLVNDERMKLNITIAPETQQLDEVTIVLPE